MTRDEYEARRRRLDEELRAAMELLKTGHLAQVQMLDLLWKMSTDGTALPATPATPPLPAAPSRPRRRGPGELADEVIALLPQLPEIFTKDDVAQALSEPADRSSLFRVLQELQASGWFQLDCAGQGRYPTTYRHIRRAKGDTKLSPETPPTAPAAPGDAAETA